MFENKFFKKMFLAIFPVFPQFLHLNLRHFELFIVNELDFFLK